MTDNTSHTIKFFQPFSIELRQVEEHLISKNLYQESLEKLQRLTSNNNIFFTPSCTDALELSALLLNIKQGDEIIAPSFTLSATLNPFILRGATIKFSDSLNDSPNASIKSIEQLITNKTRAIIVVHYAGISCDMHQLKQLSESYGIPIIEDAAHCINAYYNTQHLGTIGDIGTVSFHESKNIHCFEGGAIIVKDDTLFERVDIIGNMGTNKTDFLLGKTYRYDWVDIGSSYRISTLSLAYLFEQLINVKTITQRRKAIFDLYNNNLSNFPDYFFVPKVPEYAINNGHIFFIKCHTKHVRDQLMSFLNINGVQAVKHYEALHTTKYGGRIFNQKLIPDNALNWSDTILRLPIHYFLKDEDIHKVCGLIIDYFKNTK